MDESFGKAGYLYVEYFFTAFLQSVSGGGKRMRIDRTCQAESVRSPNLEVYNLCLLLQQTGCSIHETGVYLAVVL